MYEIIEEKKYELLLNGTQKELAEKVGIREEYLSRIFNRRNNCSKMVAFAIVKSYKDKAEVEDYFIKV